MSHDRKRVLIVYDVDGWAEHRHAMGVQAYAPPEYEVDIRSLGQGCLTPEQWQAYDAAYFLYLSTARKQPGMPRLTGLVASHAWMHEELDRSDYRTYGTIKGRRCYSVAREVISNLDGVIVRNRELEKKFAPLNKHLIRIPAGVDPELFPFRPASDYEPGKRPLRVGWCAQAGGISNFKGYDEILVPLMEQMKNESVEWVVNRRTFKDRLSVPEMRDWYCSIDIFISTASAEGTPNPPFEAAACGRPVISTNVGCMADWDLPHERGLVAPVYHNPETADVTIGIAAEAIRQFLSGQRSTRVDGEILAVSIGNHFHYDTIAPRILQFVCGEEETT